jgi:hypothetical protein
VGTSFHIRLPAKQPKRALTYSSTPIVQETVPTAPEPG